MSVFLASICTWDFSEDPLDHDVYPSQNTIPDEGIRSSRMSV